MNINPLHATDFYKTGHYAQSPKDTEFIYENWTCRADKFFQRVNDDDHKVVFFGLQFVEKYLLIELWNKNFFNKPKEEVIQVYKRRMDKALGPDVVDTKHIEELHDLGYLPIKIKSLPEGSKVDIRVPMFTITNTVVGFAWLVGYLETAISSELWGMITAASIAYEYRKLFDAYANHTGAPKEFVPWQGHDFSARGMLTLEGGASTGAAHLLSFYGTDTILALDFLEEYYHGQDAFLGGSVPATEHSVMCMGGKVDEIDTYIRLITEVYPKGIVSIVSDTWDFWQVVTDYTAQLKDLILSREGKVVLRPDSGDPVKIIVGDPDAPVGSPEYKGMAECLWDIFGGTETEKGFKVLDSHIGCIYGDSITLERAKAILFGLAEKGFASNNIVLGIGSFTYNFVTRDTLGQALKATAGRVAGEFRELFKKPKTDSGLKNSLCGFIRVEKNDSGFVVYDQQSKEQESLGCLTTSFHNGTIMNDQTVIEIRKLLLND